LYTFNHIQYAEVKKKTFVGINFWEIFYK
jgi:hypothetical protein